MKAKVKSIKVNMILNSILTMSNVIFPIITYPYVARTLLQTGIGKVEFVTANVSYFAMFAQMGIPTYGIRACAKIRDNKEELSRTVHELLLMNFALCILVYIVFGAAIMLVPKMNQEKELFLIIGLTIGLNALGVEWLYKALEQYSYITIRSVIFKLVALIATFLLIHQKEDYKIYGAITIFAASASNILNFTNLRKYIYVRPVGGYHFKRHIRMILVFFSMSVATTIYTNLDKVMLGYIKTEDDVGYYGTAVKIKSILVSLVTSASTVLLPRASYYIDKGMKEEFYRIIKKTMRFILLLAAPLSLYFIIYAREGILLLSGPEFAPSIVPMQIIMPTLLLIGMTNVIGIQMLIPLGKEKLVLYSEIAGAVVDLVLNFLLIPRYASAGAALGTLVAEIVVLIWQMLSIRAMPVKLFDFDVVRKIIFALICSAAACFWVKWLPIGVFSALLLSAVCFFGVYAVCLAGMKEQLAIELFGQLLSKFRKKR